jgi:hypothetical protein
VTSSICFPLAAAMRRRFHVGDSRRSIWPRHAGPTAIFCMYVSGAFRNWPSSAIAMTLIASGGAGRAQVRALERIDRDVDPRRVGVVVEPAGADLLADVQHRRLVALAFADHHGAADVDGVEGAAHGLDRDVIGQLAIAAAHEPGRRQGRRLRDPNDFQGQVAIVHRLRLDHGRRRPGNRLGPARDGPRVGRRAGSARAQPAVNGRTGRSARSSSGKARGRPVGPITAWRVQPSAMSSRSRRTT